ncbi:MAG: hypothetical protein FJW30_02390 [Acidobacteria bacterium]|nr:hypothetical protein [Acidobacteriota bacterium]
MSGCDAHERLPPLAGRRYHLHPASRGVRLLGRKDDGFVGGKDWRGALEAPGAVQIPDDSFIATAVKPGGAGDSYVLGTGDKNHRWAFVYSSLGHSFTLDTARF